MRFPIDITADEHPSIGRAIGKVENRFKRLQEPSARWRKDVLDAVKPFDALHRSVERIVKPIARVHDSLAGLGRTRGSLGGASSAARSLAQSLRQAIPGIGDVANDNGLAGAAGRMSALGEAGEAAGGGLEAAAGSAGGLAIASLGVVGAVGGAAVAVAGAGVAGLEMAAKWDSSVVALDNLSKNIGISIVDLQAWKAAAEQAGVKADDMATAIGNIRRHANAVRLGQDPTAQSILQTYGVNPQDFAKASFAHQADLIGAITRQQSTPQMQALVAEAFGAGGILPLLRQRPGQTRAAMDIYKATGSPITAEQAAKDRARVANEARTKQAIGGVGNRVGQFGSDIANPVWAAGAGFTSLFAYMAHRMMGGKPGAPATGAPTAKGVASVDHLSTAFDTFARRIEQMESGGRQFWRAGGVKVSPKGAVGAMQLLPATARRVAQSLGEAFDPARLLGDQGYNEHLGRAELARLLKVYGGDQTLAAAAYNAGEKRVNQWLHRPGMGDPRSGRISDASWAAMIPFRETRDYVRQTAQPQKIEVVVTLANLPAGSTATAHNDHGPVPVKIGHSQVGRS
jgi:hypothetical protein